MTITEIRNLTGLSMMDFSSKYEIPYRTLQKWEMPITSPNHRECPIYVKKLLERAVREDYNTKETND